VNRHHHAVTCTVAELGSLLGMRLRAIRDRTLPASAIAPLMIWGPPGVGKSTAVRRACGEAGIGFLDIRLSQREAVDLRGLPVPRGDRVEWLLSSEWPRDPASRGVILFDEINAADRGVQVAAYELVLDRRLGDLYRIPEGWYVCAAGNRADDDAAALAMPSALANRFCHVEVGADAASWLEWAVAEGLHPDVVGFLRSHPAALLCMDGDLERGWPSPRSWARVSAELRLLEASGADPEELDRIARIVVRGLVGAGAAVEFLSFRRSTRALPDVVGMLRGDVPISIPDRADLRHAMCSALTHHVRRGDVGLVGGFLRVGLALPSDFAALAMSDAVRGAAPEWTSALIDHPLFVEWCARHGAATAGALAGVAAALAKEAA